MSKKLSIVIPLFNEKESLNELYNEINSVCNKNNIDYEIIFVDDGSNDGSFDIIRKLHSSNKKCVKAIRFMRNYGKAAALSKGFSLASGEYIMTMDADLQDNPNEIPIMIEELEKGFDMISGWKKKRFDPLSKRLPSKIFNFVTSIVAGIRLHDFNCGLKIYKSEVCKSIKLYGELHRFIPVLAHWSGFKVGEKVVEHRSRKFGHSKYGIRRFFSGFFDLMTVILIGKYLKKPLHIFGIIGLLSFFLGFGIDAYLSILWMLNKTSLQNRPLLFLGLLLMLLGIQLFSTGLIGEMITHTTQNNDDYLVKEYLNE